MERQGKTRMVDMEELEAASRAVAMELVQTNRMMLRVRSLRKKLM